MGTLHYECILTDREENHERRSGAQARIYEQNDYMLPMYRDYGWLGFLEDVVNELGK